MSTMAPLPKDHPIMVAWERYQLSGEYRNSFRWAAHEEHRQGSMWAAFLAGFQAAEPRQETGGDDAFDPLASLPGEYEAGRVIREAVEHDPDKGRFYLTCSVGELAQRICRAASGEDAAPEPTAEVVRRADLHVVRCKCGFESPPYSRAIAQNVAKDHRCADIRPAEPDPAEDGDALLPCPFCGSAAIVMKDDSYGACGVGCTHCHAEPWISTAIGGLDWCKREWNRRDRRAAPAEDGEKLRAEWDRLRDEVEAAWESNNTGPRRWERAVAARNAFVDRLIARIGAPDEAVAREAWYEAVRWYVHRKSANDDAAAFRDWWAARREASDGE